MQGTVLFVAICHCLTCPADPSLFKCFSSSFKFFEVVMYLYLLILLVSFTLSQLLAKLLRNSSGCVNKDQAVWFGLAQGVFCFKQEL